MKISELKRRWHELQLEALAKDTPTALSKVTKQLAAEAELTPSEVKEALQTLKLWPEPKKAPKKTKAEMEADFRCLYDAGLNDTEIAANCNCQPSAVFRWRKAHGMPSQSSMPYSSRLHAASRPSTADVQAATSKPTPEQLALEQQLTAAAEQKRIEREAIAANKKAAEIKKSMALDAKKKRLQVYRDRISDAMREGRPADEGTVRLYNSCKESVTAMEESLKK